MKSHVLGGFSSSERCQRLMMTVMVAVPLPATGAVAGDTGGGGGGGVVVVGESSRTVTTRVWAGGGAAGWESGWMATAAPTPPTVNSIAATRPSSAPPFPNTLLPSPDDDPSRYWFADRPPLSCETFVQMTGPIDGQISMRWHQ